MIDRASLGIAYDPTVLAVAPRPLSDNAIDLGLTALQFRTLFLRTGIESSGAIKLKPSNSEALQVDSTGIRTNLTAFTIYTNTVDGSDDSQISITAGGSAMDATRGGFIRISGNEHANGGSVLIRSGDASGGSIIIDAYGSAGTIALKNQNSHILWITALGAQFQQTVNAIYTNTSDTSDNASLSINGGGGVSDANRGCYILLRGNEHASAGALSLYGGNTSAGNINLFLSNSSAAIRFLNASSALMWTVNNSGDINQDSSNGGDFVFNKTTGIIRQGTSDGADNKSVIVVGGGGTTKTRGSFLSLNGNESAGAGWFELSSGDASGASGNLTIGSATGSLRVLDASGNLLFQFKTNTNLLFGNADCLIAANTSDGTDNKAAAVAGGGAASSSRGAYILAYGNEHTTTGVLTLAGGAVSAGHINLTLGHSSAKIQLLNASAAVMWDCDNSGNLNQNATNGGNIILGKSSSGIIFTADSAVSAAGSSASDATVLTKNVNFVSTVAASTGVKLWNGGAGFGPIIVRNGGANTLTVYAPTGHTINGGGNSQTCSTTQTIAYFQVSSTNWIALKA